MKRPLVLYMLIIFHLFLSIGAIGGGGMFILRPDASLLGMQSSWLEKSPFNNYLVPGFILFTMNGLWPLLTIVGLAFKPGWRWANACNIYKNRHWAWTYSLYSGIIAITWITVQQVMTHYFWIQPIIILTGLLIIICTMWPSVMQEFEKV